MKGPFGIGPKFALATACSAVPAYAISMYFAPLFVIPLVPYAVLAVVGTTLVVVGAGFKLLSLLAMLRAKRAGELVTTGTYSLCRHPM